MSRDAVMSSDGIDARLPQESQRAAAHQIEPASLELVRAANRFHSAQQDDGAVRVLLDAEIAANRDVHVAERRAVRSARAQLFPTQDEVVGDQQVHVEAHRCECATGRGRGFGFCRLGTGRRGRRLRLEQRLPGRIFGAAARFDGPLG